MGGPRRWADALGDRFEMAKVIAGEARQAVLESDLDRADELFAQSVRQFEELEVPFEYARTLYEWGVRTRNPALTRPPAPSGSLWEPRG